MNLEKAAVRTKRILGLVVILGLAILVVGIVIAALAAHNSGSHTDLATIIHDLEPGILIACFGLAVTIAGAVLQPLTALRFQQASDASWRYEQVRGAIENQRQQLEAIRESVSLSDAAKQIAYRHKDREALRHAIREDIDKNDYEAAYWLTSEMERRFGSKQESAQFRDIIESSRRKFIETEVREALTHFDLLLKRFDWAACYREMEQLMKMFSFHPDIQRLPERVQNARETHKRALLKEWKDAVSRDDVDRSVELLKQLDQYLTPGEAEGYKEIARDVFKKRLQQLGVQFALHVSDKNWPEAARIGQQIIDEFPNARIAAEVRDRMPIIREKAAQAGSAVAI